MAPTRREFLGTAGKSVIFTAIGSKAVYDLLFGDESVSSVSHAGFLDILKKKHMTISEQLDYIMRQGYFSEELVTQTYGDEEVQTFKDPEEEKYVGMLNKKTVITFEYKPNGNIEILVDEDLNIEVDEVAKRIGGNWTTIPRKDLGGDRKRYDNRLCKNIGGVVSYLQDKMRDFHRG
jgi:hypothetical protein